MSGEQFELNLKGQVGEDDIEITPAPAQEKSDCKICGVEIGYGNCPACSREKGKEELRKERKVA